MTGSVEVVAMRRTAMAILFALVLAGCTAAPAPPPPVPTFPAGPPAAAAEAGRAQALPVYYVADTPAGFRSVQQLVFTVQGALQSGDPVRILRDGAAVEELWGAVRTAQPVARGDVYALRSLVQIDTPGEGATVGREVRVSGEAAVFEATVRWEVRQGEVVVQSGFTSSAEGQRFAPYEFSLTLPPGEYTVQVMEDDPSDGAGRPVLVDDKTIIVAP